MGPIATRLAALDPRERRFLLAGAAALSAFLLYIVLPVGGVPAPEEPRGTPPPVPAFHQSPPEAAPPAPAGVAAPTASLSGVMLRGVLGGGPRGGTAIIAFPDGSQRSVPVGREFLPGVTLKKVALRHVIVKTRSGESRLEFDKAAREIAPAAVATAATGGTDPDRRRETLEFRTGLMPLKEEGRIKGFAIRPGANPAIFQRAGLKPGDVVVSVNGQAFRSEEKVLELSAELASARTIEIGFIRDGRRMTGKVERSVDQR